MEVKAVTKYVRISAKKMRDVAREIQGLSVSQATDILTFTPKKGAYLLNKTLKSALANAENNKELSVDELIVKS
ncbi:MAG: uL22 family ribosomal protein, partial [Akkermansia sp.]